MTIPIGGVGYIECRRSGRKRPDGSWTIVAQRIQRVGDPDIASVWVAGYAYPNTWHGVPDAKRNGWHVKDADGNLLLSSAEGTKIGNGLGECLYMFARKLMEGESRV